jgi:uncharacterized protein YjeT (DUF2065 family)
MMMRMETAFQTSRESGPRNPSLGEYKGLNYQCQSQSRAVATYGGANVFDKGSPEKLYKPIFTGTGCGEPAADDAREMRSGMTYFLCVLGMVLILEGLPYFAFPGRMKEWLVRIAETPDGHLRRVGLALMAVGLGLVYMGRS